MITSHKLIIILTTLILSLHFFHFADAKKCIPPSACGAIRNISYPFGLKSNCGLPEYELTCENNVIFLYLNSIKYYVKAINYDSSTIRLVDASINNDTICSFPTHSSYPHDLIPRSFSDPYHELMSVNLISCPNPINNSSLFIDITQDCASNLSHPRFSYVNVVRVTASEVPHLCDVDLSVMIPGGGLMDPMNASLPEIHQSLLYGFELHFMYAYIDVPSTAWDRKANLVN